MQVYKIEPEETRFSKRQYLKEVRRGVLISSGMALLWSLEIGRNLFFAMLDRIGFPALRRKSVSAFPPGDPAKAHRQGPIDSNQRRRESSRQHSADTA